MVDSFLLIQTDSNFEQKNCTRLYVGSFASFLSLRSLVPFVTLFLFRRDLEGREEATQLDECNDVLAVSLVMQFLT